MCIYNKQGEDGQMQTMCSIEYSRNVAQERIKINEPIYMMEYSSDES